jgi:hypothetical protein
MSKKFIIVTSIFEPTEAVKKFSKVNDFNMIVVGDKKSPPKYDCENVEFLAWDKELPFSLAKKLPFNHYCRKMLGYLWAMQQGAEVIYDTDDDNLPLDNWNIPEFSANYDITEKNQGFLNIYNYYTEQKIWPRGFPLPEIIENKKVSAQANETINVGIWQGLADGDPDVDAIYRLTDNTPCYFDKNKAPIIFNEGTLCPFNSQNTAFRKELFALLYLPSTVTFRYTDILRGLVAQPIMWNAGFKLGFTTATVFQNRNVHNYLKDFESEIPCYLFAQKVIELATNSIKSSRSVADNLLNVYEALHKENIVEKQELEILSVWIKDLSGY